MKTFVYVISGDHGRQKIGISDDPAQRIRNLQTGSPYTLRFEFVGEVENDSAGAVEVEAHFMLNAHKAPGGDEWFMVPSDVAITAVMAAAHRLGYRCKPVDPDALLPKSYTVAGRPAWHLWIKIPVLLYGFFYVLPGVFDLAPRGDFSPLIVAIKLAITIAIIAFLQWWLIKAAQGFAACFRWFDQIMHPEGGPSAPVPD